MLILHLFPRKCFFLSLLLLNKFLQHLAVWRNWELPIITVRQNLQKVLHWEAGLCNTKFCRTVIVPSPNGLRRHSQTWGQGPQNTPQQHPLKTNSVWCTPQSTHDLYAHKHKQRHVVRMSGVHNNISWSDDSHSPAPSSPHSFLSLGAGLSACFRQKRCQVRWELSQNCLMILLLSMCKHGHNSVL